jgi:hypothetical protein
MPDRNPGTTEKEEQKPLAPGEVRLRPAGESVVTHKNEPPQPLVDKQIHPRRPLPLVPEPPEKDNVTP